MALRAEVHSREPIETIQSMEDAALARYNEALAIAFVHDSDAITAAYLFGYVAEILLKAAIGRIWGLGTTDNLYDVIRMSIVASERHDLSTLLELAILSRNPVLRPLDEAGYRFHIDTIDENWSVDFRYKTVSFDLTDLQPMFESISWLCAHQDQLWS